MLVWENNQPDSVQDLDARICWLSEQPMRPGTRFEVRHTSREAKAVKEEVITSWTSTPSTASRTTSKSG